MSTIDTILEQNRAFANGFSDAGVAALPQQGLAIVTCMDARIDAWSAFGLGYAHAHVIRNAGGVVTDDVVRSLAISQSALETREIMLVAHTRCGMLAGNDALASVIEEKAGARPDFPLHGFDDLEKSVRDGLGRLRDSAVLVERDRIRGFIYDVDTGLLGEVE